MKIRLRYFWFFVFPIFFRTTSALAQQTFYDINTIQKIEIFFSQPNWDYQMDTAKYGVEGYIMADSIFINGIKFDSVGVKYKGNSSYDSTDAKNPMHIALDEYANQSYQGFTDVKLGNGYQDPSMIREVLAYEILKNYMHCPRANFAQLYINGSYIGLYSNDESINKEFCSQHFYSSQNTFIKCNPIINPGPTTKSNLRYLSADSSAYNLFYEIKSAYGWNELVALCDSVTNHASGIGSIMDMDRVIWMLAFNNVLVNLDSYSGVFCQNHYLYKDSYGFFNPVIWDLNMCFGGFPFAGSGATSFNLLTVTAEQQMSPLLHSGDPYWPLISTVLNNPMYKRMYIAHMRTITNEMFNGNLYQTYASQLRTLVDTAVQSDVNKFFTYSDFQNGMTANVVVGSYTVPGISNLMSARTTYLMNTTDFSYVPPFVSSVGPDISSPLINTNVTISAMVTAANSNGVYLGYRHHISEKFTRVLMYDDGVHNDGAAGDNIYGATFQVTSAQSQYYIYAENNDAGIFSPPRAEHEFYTLNTNILTAAPGQVVINEFVADNITGAMNETGVQQDWIELYNNTSSALDLFGLYLTDDFLNPQKFAFPQNTVIPASGYKIIWADETNSTASFVHCNFRLAASGEQLMLSNNSGTVIDSITFGALGSDTSFARCPNGTGPFASLTPTFAAINCPVGIEDGNNLLSGLEVYPNPASTELHIMHKSDNANHNAVLDKFRLYNIFGAEVIDVNPQLSRNEIILHLENVNTGIYFLTIADRYYFKVEIIKP